MIVGITAGLLAVIMILPVTKLWCDPIYINNYADISNSHCTLHKKIRSRDIVNIE